MACATGVRWLYKLDANFAWDSGHAVPDDLAFRDERGTVRLIIETDGRVTVTRGYALERVQPKALRLRCLARHP